MDPANNFSTHMPSVTIRDVAREAGFSITTVSNVLRGGQGHVYPESTYTHIRSAAQRLGYQANAAARVLRQNTRTLIGLPVQLTEHPYLSRFLLAIQDELIRHDYDPVFLNIRHLTPCEENPPFPPMQMLAGLISVGIELQNEWPEVYSRLAPGAPIISLQPVSSRIAKKVDVVQVDFTDAYVQVCEHLKKLDHTNIAYLSVLDNPIPSDASKNRGWLAAIRQCGLSSQHLIDWKRTTPQLSYEAGLEKDDFIYQPEGQQAMTEVINKLTSFPKPITALVCSSDEVAIGLQSFLQSHGWKLPDQLSVVGYDGISFGEYIYPSLTTVAPDYFAMAQIAVKRVLERINSSPDEKMTAQQYLVKPHLITRSSTARLARV